MKVAPASKISGSTRSVLLTSRSSVAGLTTSGGAAAALLMGSLSAVVVLTLAELPNERTPLPAM